MYSPSFPETSITVLIVNKGVERGRGKVQISLACLNLNVTSSVTILKLRSKEDLRYINLSLISRNIGKQVV